MRASIQQILAVCLATAMGATLGGLGGYFLARSFILNHALSRVSFSAEHATDELSTSISESRRILASMNASSDGFCSPAEIERLRTFVFHSRYLKEAGRMRNGRIDCSTTFGQVAEPLALPRPDFIQQGGIAVYRNLPQFQIAGLTTIAIQTGDSFVVYNPYSNGELSALRMNFAVTAANTASHTGGLLWGELGPLDSPATTRAANGIHNGMLFATRCSAPDFACVTVYTPAAEVLTSSFSVLAVLAAMGALAGGLLGVVCSMLYRSKRSLPSQLVQALRDDALTVVYQPIVDMESGCIVEAEALARWTDDDGNPISPEVFVKIAEEQGFVGEITRLVVRRTLSDFAPTLRTRPDFRVSVNVAAPDLADPTFLPMLHDALEQAGVLPQNLGIEITESHTARQQVAKETIAQLRLRGHHVAIDDFGTGYSSLAYLHDLSVDSIKIDKAFTRTIGTDAITVSILPQILSMATELGLNVTVEGIETPEQERYFVGTHKSIRMQGWLYGHPVPAEAFLQMLEESPALPLAAASPSGASLSA